MEPINEAINGVLDPGKRRPPTPRQHYFPRKNRKALHKSIAQSARELRAKTTERDMRILEALYVMGVMSRHQIQRLEWGHAESAHADKIASNRLNTLYKRWVLDANSFVRHSMEEAGLEPCDVYMLDSVGYGLLAQAKQVPVRDLQTVGRRYKKGYGEPSIVTHDLMASEIYTQFALSLERQEDLEGNWVAEWGSALYEGDRQWVRPDGTIIIRKKEDDGKPIHFFLEVDRHSAQSFSRRWGQKVAAYENARRRAQWRGRLGMEVFPPVLAVVPDGYGERVSRVLKRHLDKQTGKPVRWCVKEWHRILEGDVLSNWYDLATGEGFNLA